MKILWILLLAASFETSQILHTIIVFPMAHWSQRNPRAYQDQPGTGPARNLNVNERGHLRGGRSEARQPGNVRSATPNTYSTVIGRFLSAHPAKGPIDLIDRA